MKNNLLAAIFLIFLLFGCTKPSEELMVATAANVQYVMQEIKAEFEKETGDKVQIIIGSSGKLTTQIREGAPYDVFVSADTKYPEEIFKNGGSNDAPKVYATGKLVLWSTKLSKDELNIEKLTDPTIRKIAIANPKTAPYGLAAIQTMENSGIYDGVKSKLVYGESISQTTQFISSGSAEVGFNALSIVLSPSMKDIGSYIEIDDKLYQPILQSAILLRHSDNSPKKAKSEAFYNFLYSSKAKAIFTKYGYK